MGLNDIVDENIVIHKIGSMIYYLGIDAIVDNLIWNEEKEWGGYLTLKEISEQLNGASVRVIMDYGLSGKIYEYGNYNDGKWRLYGITKGFA